MCDRRTSRHPRDDSKDRAYVVARVKMALETGVSFWNVHGTVPCFPGVEFCILLSHCCTGHMGYRAEFGHVGYLVVPKICDPSILLCHVSRRTATLLSPRGWNPSASRDKNGSAGASPSPKCLRPRNCAQTV